MRRMREYLTRLEKGQSMRSKRLEEARDRDAASIHREIRKNPGIAKKEVATRLRLSPQRVKAITDWINEPESGLMPVRYGVAPVHGEQVRGWFTVDRKPRHILLQQKDQHLEQIEYGVRFRRLIDLLKAEGIPGAEAAVVAMEEQLGVSVEKLSETDIDAFIELVLNHN